MVRINSLIPQPSTGWGKIDGSAVGKILHLADSNGLDTEVVVSFDEDPEWKGVIGDIELVKKLYKRDYVQV